MSRLPLPVKLIIGNIGYKSFQIYMKYNKLKPNVMSAHDTVEYIIKNRCSIARYGDGELLWIFQARQDGNFEKNSPELANALKKVLITPKDNLLIGIPNIFNNLNNETKNSKTYWEGLVIRHGKEIVQLLKNRVEYGDSRFTRPYMDSKNKDQDFNLIFNNIKKIWKNRNVLIVEGDKSRFGVGTDLLDDARSVERVICPSKNAFEQYNAILTMVKEKALKIKNVIVLSALGPTATVLAYDLTNSGIQTIDIGHLDVEYVWYKMQAKSKVSIPGKYVNESSDKFVEIDSKYLETYKKEIIGVIKEENK